MTAFFMFLMAFATMFFGVFARVAVVGAFAALLVAPAFFAAVALNRGEAH